MSWYKSYSNCFSQKMVQSTKDTQRRTRGPSGACMGKMEEVTKGFLKRLSVSIHSSMICMVILDGSYLIGIPGKCNAEDTSKLKVAALASWNCNNEV